MDYLLLLYSNEEGWTSMTPEQQQQGYAAYMAYNEALNKAGVYKASQRLQPVAAATTVRVTDGKRRSSTAPTSSPRSSSAASSSSRPPISTPPSPGPLDAPEPHHGTVEVRPIWPMEAKQTGSSPNGARVAAKAS